MNWADEVDKVQPGAMAKIRKLISSRLPYTWEEFKAWFDVNFSTIGVAGRLAPVNLFFEVNRHFMTAAAEAEDQGGVPSQLPPFTPFMQGPSPRRSVRPTRCSPSTFALRHHKSERSRTGVSVAL